MTHNIDENALRCLVAGDRKCMFGTPQRFCGRPAVVHVLRADDSTTMDCQTHASWWTHHPYQDLHPIGGACGLPDTTWEFSKNTCAPGRCTIEGLSHIPDLFAGEYAVHS